MGRVDFQIVIVRPDMVLTNLPCGASCFRKAHIDNEVENVCPYSWIGGEGGCGCAGCQHTVHERPRCIEDYYRYLRECKFIRVPCCLAKRVFLAANNNEMCVVPAHLGTNV